MSRKFKSKSLICALLGGLLLSLPLAQAEITSQTLPPITLDQAEVTKPTLKIPNVEKPEAKAPQALEPVTLDQTKITKPALEKPSLPPDRSNQAGTFHRDHYTLKTTYGRYAQLKIEEKPVALQGSLKEGSRAFLYTVQNGSSEPLALIIHNTLSPKQAMTTAREDRWLWAVAPMLALPAGIAEAGKLLYIPIGMGMGGVGKSPGKYGRLYDSIILSLIFGPLVIPAATILLIAGVVGTVVLIPVALVKTPISLATAKRNDRLARVQIKASDFKQDQTTISIPAGQSVQFAILSQKSAEIDKLPLFAIEVSP